MSMDGVLDPVSTEGPRHSERTPGSRTPEYGLTVI
jgi:hypothetical protein